MLRFLSLMLFFLFSTTFAVAEDEACRLSLRETLALAIERNLDLQIAAEEVPISAEGITAEEAVFDPVATVSAQARSERLPSVSVFSGDAYDRQREYLGTAALSKRFRTGMEGSLSLKTLRQSSNSAIIGLNPQYRSFLVFNVTQPLLRDFGSEANTTNLRIAQQRRRQAGLAFIDSARQLAGKIEQAYIEAARTSGVLSMRLESRALAQELLEGNRKKFDSGLISISEIQEAQTALMLRDDDVLLARQQMEIAVNNLQDLLEIEDGKRFQWSVPDEEFLLPEESLPPLEEAKNLALDNRPDLEGQRIELAVRDIRVEFTRNQKMPRLDLQATLGTNGLSGDGQIPAFSPGPSEMNPFRGEYTDSLQGVAERDGYEWAVGLNFSYPLGNRAADSRLQQARSQKRQEVYRLRRLENGIITEVDNALVRVSKSLERAQVTERLVGLAETTLSQEMQRLRSGLSDTFRILEFQEDVVEARIRKVNARAEVEAGFAELYTAMGLNLERYGIVPTLDF
jgi:outer membrane protein TolC